MLILEIEFIKLATGGMNFELRKKLKGMEFKDLYELATMAAIFEKIILDEQEMKNSSQGTYYKKWKAFEARKAYTFDLTLASQSFDDVCRKTNMAR